MLISVFAFLWRVIGVLLDVRVVDGSLPKGRYVNGVKASCEAGGQGRQIIRIKSRFVVVTLVVCVACLEARSS